MLSAELVIQAYLSGSFPMADPDEGDTIYWHTPTSRGLIPLDARFKVPKNLMRLYRKNHFELSINRAFVEVINACANRGEEDTWISSEIKSVYTELHEKGWAHSFEVWYKGELVGGLYGVSIGKVFFGESMFHTMTDASKIALVFLVEFLREQHFEMIDCQYLNPHLLQFGAYEVSQVVFLEELRRILYQY